MSVPSPSVEGMERFVDQDLTGAEFRECLMSDTRLIGVVMQDAEIDGLVTNLVVNGVEVMRLRRGRARPAPSGAGADPLRRPGRPARGHASAARPTGRRPSSGCAATPGIEHRSVNDEWSAVQTLRHLVFVHDSWFRRCCSAPPTLFTPMGLGIDGRPRPRGAGPRPDCRADARRGARRPRRAGRRARGLARPTSPRSSWPSRRRCPTTAAGRRTPAAGACGSASARCSTRSWSTTGSACAT